MANESGGKLLSLFTVDAFTRRPFEGNGAAVCLIPFHEVISHDIKQKIASEMKLSETAFVSVIKEDETFQTANRFGLKWFTPVCEVALCGHATLASAAVLFSACNNKSDFLDFETASGILTAKKLPGGRIQIDLPAYESSPVALEKYEPVIKAAIGNYPVQEVVLSATKKLLIRLSDDITRNKFEKLNPEWTELLSSASDLEGVIVTLKGSGKDDCLDEQGNSYDFISRYFAPWFGILEDPVTGSAHSVLAPYWANILKKKIMNARQCSQRGGDIHMELQRDRVLISGSAVIVVKGEINF